MREIALFVEDSAHRLILRPLVRRIADDHGATVRLHWRNAIGGHGRVVRELDTYLRDLSRRGGSWPDLIVVATDANCEGLNGRTREIGEHTRGASAPVVFAVPDPHVERWLLLDGAAFKVAVGQGCAAPDRKCDRSRYKKRLIDAVRDAGVTPILGGLEYAEDIVREMDIGRAAQADRSFGRFVNDLSAAVRDWQR